MLLMVRFGQQASSLTYFLDGQVFFPPVLRHFKRVLGIKFTYHLTYDYRLKMWSSFHKKYSVCENSLNHLHV